ncbi:MAG: ABC transporter permease subunit, partial [Chitinivibrionales bacterium]|nr:ABC transporter permease subunit [Chitinivibrionales bacterium]
VFIWSLTDLGTPLILEYRPVVAYQIYTMINDIYENPMGYALVVVMVALIAGVYFAAQGFFLRRGTAMASRAARTVTMPTLSPFKQACAWGLFAFVIIISLLPHCMVVLSSVADKWFISVLPQKYTLSYYGAALAHPLTVRSIRNSVFLSAVTTLLEIGLGVAAAYGIRRYKFFGRRLLDFSVMLPLTLPGLILAFGYVGTFAGTFLDPRNNPIPLLIAAYAMRRLPFMVRSLDAGLRQVDPGMEEAALNLGASPVKTLYRITLPLVASSIIAGGVLVFAFSMLEVSDSLILAMKEYYYPLTKAIYTLVNRIADGFPLASALGVITMLLLGASMIVAGKILGRKMGELFRM